jgi:hypothetical protein
MYNQNIDKVRIRLGLIMFGIKKYSLRNEKRANEEKLRKLHGREIRYVSRRNSTSYVENVIGKNGEIVVTDDEFSLVCNNKVVFSSSLKNICGSDMMSLDGMILTRYDSDIDNEDKIIVYYKYYRKVD